MLPSRLFGRMRVTGLLFVLLLGMVLVLGILLAVAEVPDGHGFEHPDYATMQRGGEGLARHSRILWGGWALGTLQMLFFVALLLLGMRRRPTLRGAALIAGATLVYLSCFFMLVLSYRDYAAGGGELVLSFPVPTAWMLYGVGFAPALFIVLYLLKFEAWIIDEQELEEFVAEKRSETGT